jgi:hypothetical protein
VSRVDKTADEPGVRRVGGTALLYIGEGTRFRCVESAFPSAPVRDIDGSITGLSFRKPAFRACVHR